MKKYTFISFLFLLFGLLHFSTARAQMELAEQHLLKKEELKHALIGLSVYDTDAKKLLLQHNAFLYFTPASNTKLYSFYAGLLYLQDSTSGIQYQIAKDTLFIRGTGDPTFLHPLFDDQKAVQFLESADLPIAVIQTENENEIWGPGWSWDDYNDGYQAERTAFPIYGNVVRFKMRQGSLSASPSYFQQAGILLPNNSIKAYGFKVERSRFENVFRYNAPGPTTSKTQVVPFISSKSLFRFLLEEALDKKVYPSGTSLPKENWITVKNVPLDEMLEEMMHESDNFFAEQTLAMVSMKLFGKIDTKKVIKQLLSNELSILPVKPRWVDGSGLSRYNLFSPSDMVTILTLLDRSNPADRLEKLLPTAGKGTLTSFYSGLEGKLFAKTGSLSNNYAISGYLYSAKGHKLIFSIMVNHTNKPLNVSREAIGNLLRALSARY